MYTFIRAQNDRNVRPHVPNRPYDLISFLTLAQTPRSTAKLNPRELLKRGFEQLLTK